MLCIANICIKNSICILLSAMPVSTLKSDFYGYSKCCLVIDPFLKLFLFWPSWQFSFTFSKSIKKDSKEEIYCQLPKDTKIEDFGAVPRSRYPLVALLTLADKDDREIYDIVSNLQFWEHCLHMVWMLVLNYLAKWKRFSFLKICIWSGHIFLEKGKQRTYT